MKDTLFRINSTAKSIWRKMRNKEYRDAFAASHISNTVSAQIHSMRKARKWTQDELANRCDMRQSRISALEDPDFENIEIGTLQRLASAFDVALSVRFVAFSEIAQRASSLTSSDFVVRDYSSDGLAEHRANLSQEPHNIRIVIQPNLRTKTFSEPLNMLPSFNSLTLPWLLPEPSMIKTNIPVVRH